MFPALIAAGASLLGNMMAQEGQEDTNAANYAMSVENRDWQERMSSTAHQREVADLIAAGLNPILSANKSGASTPGGNVPVFHNPSAVFANSGSDMVRSASEYASGKQNRNIKRPLENIAGSADSGVDFIREGIKGAVEGIFDKLPTAGGFSMPQSWHDAAAAGSKLAESASSTVASAVETVKDVAGKFGVAVADVIDSPGKFVAGAVNSAKEVHRIGTERSRSTVPINASASARDFEGSRTDVMRDIARIKDPVKRAEVTRYYRLWRQKFAD